jgi:hypothetical protein
LLPLKAEGRAATAFLSRSTPTSSALTWSLLPRSPAKHHTQQRKQQLAADIATTLCCCRDGFAKSMQGTLLCLNDELTRRRLPLMLYPAAAAVFLLPGALLVARISPLATHC